MLSKVPLPLYPMSQEANKQTLQRILLDNKVKVGLWCCAHTFLIDLEFRLVYSYASLQTDSHSTPAQAQHVLKLALPQNTAKGYMWE